MTDNPNKKSLWDKIHIDPAMLLILLALLVYSALVIWSASGQDIGMMERKIGQIAMSSRPPVLAFFAFVPYHSDSIYIESFQ